MKIYRFSDPRNWSFARASRLGTWEPDSQCACPECGNPRQSRVKPLIIRWEPGSDVVGDFVWPGFDDEVVVSLSVLETLEGISGFTPGPVEMRQDPKLARSKGKPRVSLPYNGVPLFDLWVTSWVHMAGTSSATLSEKCEVCGFETYALDGVEKIDSAFDASRRMMVNRRIERVPGAGIFVEGTSLCGADVFRLKEFPSWIFLTDRVKRVLENAKKTKVSFLEMGGIK